MGRLWLSWVGIESKRDEHRSSRFITLNLYAKKLEAVSDSELNLTRIAKPVSNRAVEVEEQRC
jgi:hypothetical protein